MPARVKVYVFFVAALSAAAFATVFGKGFDGNVDYLRAGLSFAALGLLSEFLAYKKVGRREVGSIAFLPYIAGILLAPIWTTIAAIAAATFIAQVVHRRAPIKSLFNIAQITLAASVCLLCYVYFGGKSLLGGEGVVFQAYVIASIVYVTTNSLALNGVFAISEGKGFVSFYQRMSRATIVYDLFALPFVYVFAWFYISFGLLGAVALTIPMLGVRELYKKNWQLQQTNQELLELMVAAIEARDPYTSGHSRRVARNARRIAEAMGLRAREVERVAVAALLHDVGKIHEIYGPILSKPGRLTSEEFAIMQTHPIKSAELVAMVSQLQDLVLPVRHHHENWDGTGYPDKLSGEGIPLASRIITFADTIDAMTTDRPYRPALTPHDVRRELMRMRGKQFDPHICDILLASRLFDSLFDMSEGRDTPQALMIPKTVTA